MSQAPIAEQYRIIVVGTSGSGKTTMAHNIAERLRIPHIELDSLYWKPNWQGTSDEEFFRRISEALSGNEWVVDGNYGRSRKLSWGRARTIVWLDYSLLLVMRRVIWRTLRRLVTREKMWNGNQESLKMMFSKDSIILWAFNTYRGNKKRYEECMRAPEYKHLTFVRLRTPKEAEWWFQRLPVRHE